MNESMIFKLKWERQNQLLTIDLTQASVLLQELISEPPIRWRLLTSGLANTHYRADFAHHQPLVVRFYQREHKNLEIEAALYQTLSSVLPVPEVVTIQKKSQDNIPPFMVMKWIDGVLMRDVILTGDAKAIQECAFEAGLYLNQLRQITFPDAGFFNEHLKIEPFQDDEQLVEMIPHLLNQASIQNALSSTLHQEVCRWWQRYGGLLPSDRPANLVHGDYDPANMLVKYHQDQWKIVGILDWEFAFSGSYLMDMGLLLRYSHRLPSDFEKSFVQGIESGGFKLPPQWKIQSQLMNLLCLLHLLSTTSALKEPIKYQDIKGLIQELL